jgi:hypothetical protein
MEVNGDLHALTILSPRKISRQPLYRRRDGGETEKIGLNVVWLLIIKKQIENGYI